MKMASSNVFSAAQEVVFVNQELQEERLVGSGAPGSYALLDDLFEGEHCVLYPPWVGGAWSAPNSPL